MTDDKRKTHLVVTGRGGGSGTQVQADWNQSDNTQVDFIKNKPSLATVATSGSYNDLTDTPTIPAAPVQSDWNEADTSSLAYIANKPTIPAAQVNADWNANSGVAQILNKPTLATVATSGNYSDLNGTPTIPAAPVQSDWNEADSGSLAYIANKPSIPAAPVQSDWNEADNTSLAYIANKPSIPAAQVNADWNANSGVAQILNKPTIPAAPVQSDWNEADTSSLAYIANKPTIPAAQVNSDWNSASGVSQILNKPNLATVATTGSYPDLLDRPSLATVAETGDYEDLDNKPTIPSETETLTFTLQGGTVVTLEVYVKSDDSPYFYVENLNGWDITFNIADSIYDPSNPFDLDIYGSTDQENWSLIGNTTSGLMTATVPANGRLYIKANTDSWYQIQSYNANIKFNISDPVNVGGNIMSLLYGDGYKGKKVFPTGSSQNFSGLFDSCSIVSAENLILPATTLTDSCYNGMFGSCTSLTTAPALPATTLADNCYSWMFSGCSSLTTAPALPATTLAMGCYSQMFSDCSNLDSVITYAQDISAMGCLDYWLNSVSATGDFYNLGGAIYNIGDPSGIPSGWTEHNSL